MMIPRPETNGLISVHVRVFAGNARVVKCHTNIWSLARQMPRQVEEQCII